MKMYFRILGYARPFGWLAPLYLLCTFNYVIFGVLNLVMLIPILEVIFNQVDQTTAVGYPEFRFSFEYFIQLFQYYFQEQITNYGKGRAITFVILVQMSSVILSNFFRYFSQVILDRLKVNLIKNFRNNFYKKILTQDLSYFSDTRRGDILARGTVDMLQVENSIIHTLKVLIKDPLMILGLFLALFTISPHLMVYSLIVLPFAGWAISYLAQRLRKRAKDSQESAGRINAALDESLHGMRIIKAFVGEKHSQKQFAHEVAAYGRSIYQLSIRENLAQPVSEILGIGAACIIIFLGSQLVFSGEIKPQTLIGFLAMFSQLLPPAKAFAGATSNIQRGLSAGERIFEIIDQKSRIMDTPHSLPISEMKESLIFENVSFAYDTQPVLKNISFSIPKGKIVAIVGPSGAGKSTISDLIPRFYKPTEGVIKLDGKDISHYQLASVRSLMGIVTQDSILFNDSIRNNITFGKKGTDEEVKAAAQSANAHHFISQLSEGYETNIGDQGIKLSGGQKQRLSIARALFLNPPILILDEATSSLDSESEKLVQDAIYNLMQNRTVLVIAHRLSTIQHADQILVLNEGQIVQKGTHETLMKDGGLYKKLIEMQSF